MGFNQFFGQDYEAEDLVHSETTLPATCPHFEFGSDLANRTIQKAPVMSRKMLRECSCSFSSTGLSQWRGGLRLSAEPFSYMNLVASTVTTSPVQSAIALPKNAPRCVSGFERL